MGVLMDVEINPEFEKTFEILKKKKQNFMKNKFETIVFFQTLNKSNIDGAALASRENFVVISVNFRQGPVGFWNIRCNETNALSLICKEEYPVQTNWGLRDQLLGNCLMVSNLFETRLKLV